MKYAWIVMLAIGDLIWIVTSVVDIVKSVKDRSGFDPITKWCIGANLVFLFLVSFFTWLFSQR